MLDDNSGILSKLPLHKILLQLPLHGMCAGYTGVDKKNTLSPT